MKGDLHYRMLAGPAIDRLQEHLSKSGLGTIPNPMLAVAWVAENEDGEIVGHIILHSVPIIEGLKVRADQVGNHVGLFLIALARKFVEDSGTTQGILMHTSDERMERLIKRYGAKETCKYLQWTPTQVQQGEQCAK